MKNIYIHVYIYIYIGHINFKRSSIFIVLLIHCSLICGKCRNCVSGVNFNNIVYMFNVSMSFKGPLSEYRGRDRMAVGFTTTWAIIAYHH